MKIKSIYFAFAAFFLLVSCQFPISPAFKRSGDATATFTIINPSENSSGSRMLVSDNSIVNVGIYTNDKLDQTVKADKISDASGTRFSATISTKPGLHRFVADTYDANGNYLTHGEATVTMVTGNNAVDITLQPATSLTIGQSILLAANQIAYATVSSSVSNNVIFSGNPASFWECTSTGGFAGPGQANSMTVSMSAGVSKVLRILQGSTSGSVTMELDGWVTIRPSSGNEEDTPRFALDSLNNLYLSFADDWSQGITVLKWDGSSWTSVGPAHFTGSLIDSAVWAPMATDAANNLFIAYRLAGGVAVSKYISPSWTPVSSFPANMTGSFIAMATNPVTNQPAVLCADGSGSAYLEQYDGTTWTQTGGSPFSGATGVYYAALVFTASGTPYVAYQTPANLISVYKYSSGSWTQVGTSIAAGNAVFGFSLDTAGVPYVGYEGADPGYRANVVKFNGTSWVSVGSPDFSPSNADYFALTTSGTTPIVSFLEPTGSRIMKFDGISWITVGTFPAGGVLQDNILIATPGGTIYSSYGDGATNYGQTVRMH